MFVCIFISFEYFAISCCANGATADGWRFPRRRNDDVAADAIRSSVAAPEQVAAPDINHFELSVFVRHLFTLPVIDTVPHPYAGQIHVD